MMATDLKPCPFCGGEAAYNTVRYSAAYVAEQEWEQDTFHGVNCITCGVNNRGMIGLASKEIARDRWNLRVEAAPELLAALTGLEGILATAESNASGNPEWEAVSAKINAARAAIAKATGK